MKVHERGRKARDQADPACIDRRPRRALGVRLVFPDGWALLRMSLHDPNMPLNIESRKKDGVRVIAEKVRSLLDGFASLDCSAFQR